MIKVKQKFSCKLLAGIMAFLILISMVPISLIVYALEGEYDYLQVQNLNAQYNSDSDSVVVTWNAIQGDVESVNVSINSIPNEDLLDVSLTEYTFDSTTIHDLSGQNTINVKAVFDGNERTSSTTVTLPNNLESVGLVSATDVKNDLTMTEIVAQMPTTVNLTVAGKTEPVSANVEWNTEGTTYDKTKSETQTFDVTGTVTLPENVINRDSVSLSVTGTVNVAAAEDAVITTDIAATASKKVDESLTMSVEATGTGLTYQWYKNSSAINGATAAGYTINNVALADNNAKYYCKVTGKNGTNKQSTTLTLTVSKVDTAVGLSVTPPAQARPGEITLEATGLPNDASGSLTFKTGETTIGTITLPSNNKTKTFKASGSIDTYNFSVDYSGDETKYNSSNDSVSDYSFVKGTQVAEFITSTVPSTKTFGDADFTVKAKNTDNKGSNNFEYSIIDEKDVDGVTTPGCVATINSETGKVTLVNAGTFKVQVKAKADDDYNESEAVSTIELITVNRKEQSALSFTNGVTEVTYAHDFSVTRALSSNGSGTGEITYTFDTSVMNADHGFYINSTTGEVTYTNKATDNDKNVAGTLGTVKVVATKAADKQYKEKTTSYTFTVKKAPQATFAFETENPADLTYTENNGTTYTNKIGTNEGSVTVNNSVVYSLVAATDLDDVAINVTDLADIDASTGKITAKRSGKLTVKAYRAGNNVYEETDKTYTVTINRGTIQVGENGNSTSTGFKFDLADSSIKYGRVGFVNIASGGQSDSTQTVNYTEESDEVDISANGVISFLKTPANASTSEYSVIITATKPKTDKYEEKSITYKLTIKRDAVTNTNFKVNGNVIKDATLITSEEGWYNAKHSDITLTPVAPFTKISENGNDWADNIKRTNNAKHDIAFYLKDDEGNTTLVSNQKVNYDTQIATAKLTVVDDNNFWDKFVETITFGFWKKESKQIKIEANDNLSDIASIEYYEQNSKFDDFNKDNIVSANISWNKCNNLNRGTLSASEIINVSLDSLSNKKVVVYVKVTDYAGNISYFRSNGMIFDNISPNEEVALSDEPIINIKLSEKSEEGLYKDNVPFRLVVEDPKEDASGIKDIKVTINGKESNGKEHSKVINVSTFKSASEYNSEVTAFDSDDISDKFTFDDTFIVPKEFNSNHISILVEGIDYAGNKFDNKNNLTYLAIDTEKPAIDVKYTASNGNEDVKFSNEKYIGNNQNRKATITITELNFDNSAVDITLRRDGKKLDIAPTFKAVEGGTDSNGDQTKWFMDIDYATLVIEDGNIFDFDITYTDKAENKNDAVNYGEYKNSQNFIIDNTKPAISVEISNDDVKNEKYFKADRTAIVTIKERFFDKDYKFDWKGLTYSLNGVVGTAPTPLLTNSDDDTYVRVYKIDFTTEGDYTFDVKYTDLADNIANTYGCNSVSYKEFTVDKTAPVLDITGVADKSANKDTVAPIVSYSDINFDVNTVSIVLSGVNNGVVNYNNSVNNEVQSGTVTYADFENVKAVDDIYTLTAKLSDKAGNETSKAITFSANRFGSVYDISGLKDLISKYLQKEKDVVFAETNVDTLNPESIKIKLTANGTPKDLVLDKDYTIAKVEEKWASWSRYTYTIKKDLFKNDGTYSLSVYSVDAAGNVNENIEESKKAEISFGVDKTKPVIVPIDFEDGKQYPVESKEVTIEIKDNLKLNGVKIYLNDKEVKYENDGETYKFSIPESNSKQNVRIVATDAAGNEHELFVKDFLVSTNIFARWYNNTPLFIGSIIGVVVIAIGIIALILFRKKKQDEK